MSSEVTQATGQRLKAELFDYLCWREVRTQPEELRGEEFLVLASDGRTCWGKTYAEAVNTAMVHDKGIESEAQAADARDAASGPPAAEVRAIEQLVAGFSKAMLAKLLQKCLKEGYTGWDKPENVPAFKQALLEHLQPPVDWVDVANFSAFLWNLEQSAPPAPVEVTRTDCVCRGCGVVITWGCAATGFCHACAQAVLAKVLPQVGAARQAVEQALACGAHFHPGTQACGCKRALELVLNPKPEVGGC